MIDGVVIRRAEEEDFPPLCALYCHSVQCNPRGFIQDLNFHGCLIAMTRRWRAAGGDMLVAREAGKVVGMGGLAPLSDSQIELCKLHVDGDRQGRGIGRRLTESLIALARLRGFSEIELHVTTTQRAAIGLYEMIGFQPVRQQLFKTTVFGEPESFETLYMRLPASTDCAGSALR